MKGNFSEPLLVVGLGELRGAGRQTVEVREDRGMVMGDEAAFRIVR